MTQETEPEVDVLMQLQGSGSKRGGNYHHDEDIQLCRSWSNITTDPITANDQPSKSYWARIAEHFHDYKCFVSDRTAVSLEKRMGGILKDCMRFQGFYDEIERRHPSGIPYTEHVSGIEHHGIAPHSVTGKQQQFPRPPLPSTPDSIALR